MNFANVTEWRIPQGDVIRVTDSQNRVIWEKDEHVTAETPFYVQNIGNEVETLNIKKNSSSAPTLTIEYSTDKVNWNTLGTTSTTALTMSINPGIKVYLRANASTWANSYSEYNRIFGISKVGGNIFSLLWGDSFNGQTNFTSNYKTHIFYRIFGDSNIVDASKLLLLATTLLPYCYSSMFAWTRLEKAPKLYATTLANYCYENMFATTSITEASELPVTTLAEGCYYGMFNHTNITTTPQLPATIMASNCYQSMFSGCNLLTTTVETLPATTLATHCYDGMFAYCQHLEKAPKLPATTLATHCYDGMFELCIALTDAPELPAQKLVPYCYQEMFHFCSNLTSIKCLAQRGFNDNRVLYNWTGGVSSTGTFTKAAGVTWPTGTSGIPSGWTVVEQ